MRRLRGHFRPRSPVPPAVAGGSNSQTGSTKSDTLASIIKVLDVAEKAVDGLPIYGPKAVISSIRTVLQSVKQSSANQGALKQLQEQVGILEASVLTPLSGCTKVPPALQSAIDDLKTKVKEAAEKWENKPERGRFMRSLLADQDATELQGFANDIREALQMFKTSADVHQMIHQFEKTASEELNKIPRARGARYDSKRSSAPSRCFEGTRTAVLERIWHWLDRPISDANVESIFWLNGLAGIGKSTIARTVAEDADHCGRLGASFFFSRQERELSDANIFIPTIAYQLALSNSKAEEVIVKAFQRDPDVVERSFTTQIERLILEPIRKMALSKPVVFVIDALDECDNSVDAAAKLFRAVVACCTEVPSIRLLITSRPERYIKSILAADQIVGIVLHEDVEQSVVSDDIWRYLRAEMSRIPNELGVDVPLPWPSSSDLNVLVGKAGKLFIWAATAIRFVGDSVERDPTTQLRILLGTSVDPNANTQNPFAALDNLYVAILSQAANKLRSPLIKGIQIVIGTIVRLRSEMPLEAIGRLLGEDTVKVTLGRIESIIPIPTDSSRPVRIYHPSFPDFITGRERCPHIEFHVDIPSHEIRLAVRCLDILNSTLSKDVERLLKPTERVSTLSEEVVLRTIPLEVQYACRFWAIHVSFQSMEHCNTDLLTKLEAFSSTMLLRWVVAMSILGGVSDAITATRTMQQWMDKSGPFSHLKERFCDTERMIIVYANIISEYPTQLYYSVLPFLPSDTYLSRQYPGRISVLIGGENSWSPLLFKLPGSFRDSAACFSLDGDTLAVATGDGIDLYDTSNGLLNSSITMPRDGEYWHEPLQSMFTADGLKVFVLFRKDRYDARNDRSCGIQTYDLAKQNVQLYFFPEKADIKDSPIELSGDGSYVVYPQHDCPNTRICIWQINGGDYTSIPIGRGGRVEGLSLTGGSSHLVAVAIDDIIIIMDIPSGRIRQRLQHSHVRNVCFSPDGSFIASSSLIRETRLFSTQGTLLATLEAGMKSLVFSHTNHLYMLPYFSSGNVRVYNALGDHNQPETRLIHFPDDIRHILPAPDDSQIAIQTMADDIQVWSPRRLTDTHDSTPHSNAILGIDLSRDASLLTIATKTEIEIWDARIGQRRDVIQTPSARSYQRPVAFSPRGELIVSSSEDGIAVVDVQAGVLRPMRYPFVKGEGPDQSRDFYVESAGISFDSSRIAAVCSGFNIRIWDLSSGTLLYVSDAEKIYSSRWSRTDLYLLYKTDIDYRYLNPETFKEEIVEEFDDRFQEADHLFYHRHQLQIRSSRRKNRWSCYSNWGDKYDPLFLALPYHLNIKEFCWHGDRVCIFSKERWLLLEISYLNTYMKEYCHLEYEPETMVPMSNYSFMGQYLRGMPRE